MSVVESENTEMLSECGKGVRGWVSLVEQSGNTKRLGDCGGGVREY